MENTGELPAYIREIARSIEKTGKSLEAAIPIAISRVKKWAAGGDGVSAKTQAKAAKALAAWNALKAKAKGKKAKSAALSALQREADAVALTAVEDRALRLSVEAGPEDVGAVALSRILRSVRN